MRDQNQQRTIAWNVLGWGLRLTLTSLVVSSCSGSASEPKSAQVTQPLTYESPIYDLLNVDASGYYQRGEEKFESQLLMLEEATADCMATQGFDYFPAVQPKKDDSEPNYYDPEWTERYGFGITTQALPQAWLSEGLVGHPGAAEQDEVDRNEEMLLSLSEAERQAFWDTLLGPTGCEESAYASAFGSDPQVIFMNELGEDLQRDVSSRVEADERVIRRSQDLEECVQNSGEETANPELLAEIWQRDLDQIRDEVSSDSESISSESAELLLRLQEDELRIARTLVSCGGGPRNDVLFTDPIRIEYEERFIEENGDRISLLLAETK